MQRFSTRSAFPALPLVLGLLMSGCLVSVCAARPSDSNAPSGPSVSSMGTDERPAASPSVEPRAEARQVAAAPVDTKADVTTLRSEITRRVRTGNALHDFILEDEANLHGLVAYAEGRRTDDDTVRAAEAAYIAVRHELEILVATSPGRPALNEGVAKSDAAWSVFNGAYHLLLVQRNPPEDMKAALQAVTDKIAEEKKSESVNQTHVFEIDSLVEKRRLGR